MAESTASDLAAEATSDTPGSPVLAGVHDGVLSLVLNRPGLLNALNLEMYRRICDHVARVEYDPTVRCILLTGSGRAFSVGTGLKTPGEGVVHPGWGKRHISAGIMANRMLQTTPLPVVAAVNGPAIGPGLELALSADFIVVASEARLRFPEVALGAFVGGGATATLPARVGLTAAKEILMLCREFSGRHAAEMGIANLHTERDRVVTEAMGLCEELKTKAPYPLAAMKREINRLWGEGERARDVEGKILETCMGMEDWKEGVTASQERRDPVYLGR